MFEIGLTVMDVPGNINFMNYTKNQTQHKTNSATDRTIRKLNDPARAIISRFSEKFGKVYVEILQNWPYIIGTRYAEIAKVASLKYIKNPNADNQSILTVICPSAHMPILQMQSPQVLNRINGYFGYNAVVQIKYIAETQRVAKPKPKPIPQPLKQEYNQKINNLTQAIENDNLKSALRKLGESLYLAKQESHAHKTRPH